MAEAGGSSIAVAIVSDDLNTATQIMARGAALLCTPLHSAGRIDWMIALGGTMGTDLVQTLPKGVPKYIVSTVPFSRLIPLGRLSPDIQMMLWVGGLYGLNWVCKSSLSRAGAAMFGAAHAVGPPVAKASVIGMACLGSSCLSYMKLARALAAMLDEMAQAVTDPLKPSVLDCHINDAAFAGAALGLLDRWIADGTVKTTLCSV